MSAMRNTVAALIAVALAGSGCATQPQYVNPQEQLAAWLSAAPRTLSVSVKSEALEHAIVVPDYKAGERVLGGVTGAGKGALVTIGMFCAGGGFGCIAGMFLAPVGALIGAVGGAAFVKTTTENLPLGEARGATELLQAAVHKEDLAARMADYVCTDAKPAGRHLLTRLPGVGGERSSGPGSLTLEIQALDLFGSVGDDPSVSLVLRVSASVEAPQPDTWRSSLHRYEGLSRPLSEWRANGEALFREELDTALRTLAAEIRAELRG
jgi:hypothetical protein